MHFFDGSEKLVQKQNGYFLTWFSGVNRCHFFCVLTFYQISSLSYINYTQVSNFEKAQKNEKKQKIIPPGKVEKNTRFASKKWLKKWARSFENVFFMLFCTRLPDILYSKKNENWKIGKNKKSKKT